ncbi:unnamed protein product [Caretta caretta]
MGAIKTHLLCLPSRRPRAPACRGKLPAGGRLRCSVVAGARVDPAAARFVRAAWLQRTPADGQKGIHWCLEGLLQTVFNSPHSIHQQPEAYEALLFHEVQSHIPEAIYTSQTRAMIGWCNISCSAINGYMNYNMEMFPHQGNK